VLIEGKCINYRGIIINRDRIAVAGDSIVSGKDKKSEKSLLGDHRCTVNGQSDAYPFERGAAIKRDMPLLLAES